MKKIPLLVMLCVTAFSLFATTPSEFGKMLSQFPVANTDGMFAPMANPAGLGVNNSGGLGYLGRYNDEEYVGEDYALFFNADGLGFVYENFDDHDFKRLATGSKIFRNFYFGTNWDWNTDFGDGNLGYAALYRPTDYLSMGVHNLIDFKNHDNNTYRVGLSIRPVPLNDWSSRVTFSCDLRNEIREDREDPSWLKPLATIDTEILDGLHIGGGYDFENESAFARFGLSFESIFAGNATQLDKDSKVTGGLAWIHLSAKDFRPRGLFKGATKNFYEYKIPGQIVDKTASTRIGPFLFYKTSEAQIADVINRLQELKNDPAIDGLLIKGASFTASYANYLELKEAFLDFKSGGKKVVFYFESISNMNYAFAASVADEIYLNPMGDIYMSGFSINSPYVRELLDWIGIEVVNFRSHKYKTAANMFSETEMTEAEREVYNALLQDFFDEYKNMISARRSKIPGAKSLDDIVNEGPYFNADKALEYGLIDGLIYEDQLQVEMEETYGKVAVTSATSRDMVRYDWADDPSQQVAIIYATGSIHSGKSNPGASIGSVTTAAAIRAARENKAIKGIILRVDSGGGSALASDVIDREIRLCNEGENKKPVVVTMGGAAASGGYYISCHADEIIAQPTTITGSIGVVGMMFNIEKLLDKVGVNFSNVKRGEHADLGNFSRKMTDEEKKIIEDMIANSYETFIGHVAKGRRMSPDEVHTLAQGRVWTGRQAFERKLIDKLGGLTTSNDEMKRILGTDKIDIVEYNGLEKEDFLIPIHADLPNIPFLGINLPKPLQEVKDELENIDRFGDEKTLYLMPEKISTELK